uniref:Ligand dependent nuclear receptor corepressor n=1 Tax=Salmo trutta TaxID=8032 RepID=A0A674CNW6_SALTR
MQRMIRQFAAEYTSKNSYSQDTPHHPQPNGIKDQSPGSNCSGTGAAASAQNPVLSKLLMADQDSPLDLTVKRPDPTETKTEDGVLDLSTKKAHGTVLKNSHSYTLSPTVKGSLQDGLGDSYVSSIPLKPPLAHSLLIKEELLSQKHRLLGQPPALSLASLEAAGLLNHGNKGNHVQPHPLLARDGSPWGSSSGKAHHHQLDSLLRLKQASAILSDLQDLPLFLENHHHGTHHEVVVKREPGGHHSPPVDLKIPQVRGMDLSWDSHASDLYGYGAMVVGAGGHGGVENALSRKLRVILPKQNRRAGSLRGSLGGFLDGGADYWSSDVDQGTSGQPYPTSDPEGDPCSKQPRKKRGRYRQYNSQILEEAIGMVMGGKMSVSKAQNMYGIPHSTLEYKVKERLGTLKNPPKKKLKLTLRMGGQDSAAESETTPTATILKQAGDEN